MLNKKLGCTKMQGQEEAALHVNESATKSYQVRPRSLANCLLKLLDMHTIVNSVFQIQKGGQVTKSIMHGCEIYTLLTIVCMSRSFNKQLAKAKLLGLT